MLHGRATDEHTDAILRFVNALVHAHSNVKDFELTRLRMAGIDNGEIIEIVRNVGLRIPHLKESAHVVLEVWSQTAAGRPWARRA